MPKTIPGSRVTWIWRRRRISANAHAPLGQGTRLEQRSLVPGDPAGRVFSFVSENPKTKGVIEMRTKLLIGAGLLLLLIVLIVQNTQVVSIKFLFWELSLSRVLMVFLVFVSGAVVGWVANSVHHASRK